MENNEYYVPSQKKEKDTGLILVLIFLGWLGIDKFYYAKSFLAAWKFALVKLAYNIILVGVLWNIFDIVKACQGKYQFDFRDYFE